MQTRSTHHLAAQPLGHGQPAVRFGPGTFPPGLGQKIRRLHAEIPGYKPSPFKTCPVWRTAWAWGGIWVKDNPTGSRSTHSRYCGPMPSTNASWNWANRERPNLPPGLLSLPVKTAKPGSPVFATATDGNHGTGVAWAANKMGFRPRSTSINSPLRTASGIAPMAAK